MTSLPITIIGGYLGTGKTTLINHLLRHADGLRLAVLVNEFGSLSIDEDLLLAPEASGATDNRNIISIAGGCVCCSYGNDLTLAMMDLLALDPVPEHVILESSGVALPGSIAASVSLLSGYAVDGIVVLANAETVQQQHSDTYIGDTIQRQFEHADILILNKTDLIESSETSAMLDWLQRQAPAANVVSTEHGRLPPEVLLQSFLGRSRTTVPNPHHSNPFKTVTLQPEYPVDAAAVARRLAEDIPGVVRAKGFVRNLSGELVTIQVVGRRWAVSDAPDNVSLNLVVIGLAEDFDSNLIESVI